MADAAPSAAALLDAAAAGSALRCTAGCTNAFVLVWPPLGPFEALPSCAAALEERGEPSPLTSVRPTGTTPGRVGRPDVVPRGSRSAAPVAPSSVPWRAFSAPTIEAIPVASGWPATDSVRLSGTASDAPPSTERCTEAGWPVGGEAATAGSASLDAGTEPGAAALEGEDDDTEVPGVPVAAIGLDAVSAAARAGAAGVDAGVVEPSTARCTLVGSPAEDDRAAVPASVDLADNEDGGAALTCCSRAEDASMAARCTGAPVAAGCNGADAEDGGGVTPLEASPLAAARPGAPAIGATGASRPPRGGTAVGSAAAPISPGARVSRRRTGSGAADRTVGSMGARQPADGAPRRPRIAASRASADAGTNGAGAASVSALSARPAGRSAPAGDPAVEEDAGAAAEAGSADRLTVACSAPEADATSADPTAPGRVGVFEVGDAAGVGDAVGGAAAGVEADAAAVVSPAPERYSTAERVTRRGGAPAGRAALGAVSVEAAGVPADDAARGDVGAGVIDGAAGVRRASSTLVERATRAGTLVLAGVAPRAVLVEVGRAAAGRAGAGLVEVAGVETDRGVAGVEGARPGEGAPAPIGSIADGGAIWRTAEVDVLNELPRAGAVAAAGGAAAGSPSRGTVNSGRTAEIRLMATGKW